MKTLNKSTVIGIVGLTSRIEPQYPLSRLCVKVVSTWEGLQACNELSAQNINTLATTLYTLEQAVLAAECGCIYIAPFVHELKAFFDETYDDGGGNVILCHEIQQYYAYHSYPTKVKAAGLLSLEEAKALAGVTSMTVAPELLRTLSTIEVDEANIGEASLFRKGNNADKDRLERKTYKQDEQRWRQDFARAYNGKGQRKTEDVRPQLHGHCGMCSWLTVERPSTYFASTSLRPSS